MYEEWKIQDTLDALKSKEQGLLEAEAEQRRKAYGKNEITEAKQESLAASFFAQLNDPLISVLLIAAVISIFLKEVSDAAIILVVVLVNAVVGVIQEGKAKKALEALKKLSTPKAIVKRDGRWKELPSADLVKGDIVKLSAGMQVPADLRLIRTSGLKIEESALTGEAVPVEKNEHFTAEKPLSIGDCRNMAYMSTLVTYGRGEGVVCAAGMDTEIGKIASIINETKREVTPLQRRLADLGKVLSAVSVLLCVLLFAIAVLQQRDITDMLLTAISLAVAAVPEGLPAIVTIVLALSVSKMVKINTIIRKLPSVETLGSVNVVCSDKTGTLTQNKMTVKSCFIDQKFWNAQELDPQKHKQFLEGMTLCNDAVTEGEKTLGDPTETALLHLSAQYAIRKEALESIWPRIGEKPFDSKRKMMSTVHKSKGQTVTYTKGAPDFIVKRCTSILNRGTEVGMTDFQRKQIQCAIKEMSEHAFRVLAIAMRKGDNHQDENKLTFLGLIGMIDPPRAEAAEAVHTFKEASVRTVMITGDHGDTAYAIAKELGIAKQQNECMTGETLDKLNEIQLRKVLPQIHVFARVSPEHKVRIVKALKAEGNIVAMTGDGVNDAPSLQSADIGIAMGKSGTDVAKNASDMILTDDNFATIEKAIAEGRGIYENIKKAVLFLLSSNFGEIITMFLAVLFGLPAPLKASHILWINLITDSLPALALGVDANDSKRFMKQPPRKAKESLFAHGGIKCTVFYGLLIAALSLTAFLLVPFDMLQKSNIPLSLESIKTILASEAVLAKAQTYGFTVLGMSQLFHALGMRDVHVSVFRMNYRKNKLMLAAFVIGIGLQTLVTEIPYLIGIFGTTALAMEEWIRLGILSAFPILAHEIMVLIEAYSNASRTSGSIKE